MKLKLFLFFLLFCADVFAAVICPDNDAARLSIISAAKAQGTTVLLQSDFANGTKRIQSGGYYIIGENIDFQPTGTRPDEPAIGWFAVITVETSANVVIDLNGFTVRATQAYIDQFIFNAFAVIELDNSVFSGLNYGLFGSNFTGSPAFVSASNVVVMNGTTGRSAHWGIHGNNNSNIHVFNMNVVDFEVAGIEINSLQAGSLKNINITGLEHPINTSELKVGAIILEENLEGLVAGGFPGAAAQLAALEAFVAANPQIFDTSSLLPQGDAMYGILMGNGFISIANFPMGTFDCIEAATIAAGQTGRCVDLANISISGLKNSPVESIAIGTQQPTVLFGNVIQLGPAGLFGSMRWDDAYNSLGVFAPNPFLTAYAFVLNAYIYVLGVVSPTFFPANMQQILNSILTVNHAQFIANAEPIFGREFGQAVNKGLFGFRVDCCEQFTFNNCRNNSLQSVGNPGLSLSDIPDGNLFTVIAPPGVYQGNNVWGLELADDNNFTVNQVFSFNINSPNGSVFGTDLINLDQNFTVNCGYSNGMTASGNLQTTVNPPSEAYGFRVVNNAGPITVSNYVAVNTQAPRVAFGLATEGTSGVIFTGCAATNTIVTATDPFAGTNNKTAYGFYSASGSTGTQFLYSTESNSLVLGETGVTSQTPSIAAGYVFTDASQNGIVDHSSANNNHSGGGVADGVRIDMASVHTTVSNCSLSNNIADLPFAQGFGVQDTAVVSTTTLINNTFAGNSTANVSL